MPSFGETWMLLLSKNRDFRINKLLSKNIDCYLNLATRLEVDFCSQSSVNTCSMTLIQDLRTQIPQPP